jgi:lipopolysaccharide/colanic/teichoic acid biosynthesis glycosyltransferase
MGKRVFDVVVAATLLVVLSPVLLVVALAVWAQLGTPVLFRQTRPGRGGRPFTLLKFRTMNNDCDASGVLLPDEARLTAVGRFLRRMSLDELPELVNVLRADMSLVGPRPLLMDYVPRYTPEQWRRHDVRPGITGWAQVNGRNALSWDEKFALDVWYVDHRSFRLDLDILVRTAREVLSGHGVSSKDHATMPPFQGSRPDPRLGP